MPLEAAELTREVQTAHGQGFARIWACPGEGKADHFGAFDWPGVLFDMLICEQHTCVQLD